MRTPAYAITNYFTSLVEYQAPNAANFAPNATRQIWDRIGPSAANAEGARGAYYSRPLVISGGIDKQLGIAQFVQDYEEYDLPENDPATTPVPTGAVTAQSPPPTAPRSTNIGTHAAHREHRFFPLTQSPPSSQYPSLHTPTPRSATTLPFLVLAPNSLHPT